MTFLSKKHLLTDKLKEGFSINRTKFYSDVSLSSCWHLMRRGVYIFYFMRYFPWNAFAKENEKWSDSSGWSKCLHVVVPLYTLVVLSLFFLPVAYWFHVSWVCFYPVLHETRKQFNGLKRWEERRKKILKKRINTYNDSYSICKTIRWMCKVIYIFIT